MASIASIVHDGKGTAVIPESISGSEIDALALRHYNTIMLAWRKSDNRIIYLGVGHGSVSDQGGVNVALEVLGGRHPICDSDRVPVPAPGPAFYYSRAGGATYRILDDRYHLVPISGGMTRAFSLMHAEDAS